MVIITTEEGIDINTDELSDEAYQLIWEAGIRHYFSQAIPFEEEYNLMEVD